MKILSAAQIRSADQYTIEHEPIAPGALMERAAHACTTRLLKLGQADSHYHIMCGKGNNGGDGLAIARMLTRAGRLATVYTLEYTAGSSSDFAHNLELLRQIPSIKVHSIKNADEIILPAGQIIIIDAILGTGINKPTQGLIANVINLINTHGSPIIAIDVPSGLPVDELPSAQWPIIQAALTLTFQQPKLAFMFPESGSYVGAFEMLDIGLDKQYISSLEGGYYFMQDADITPMLQSRPKFSHKGTFGHALIIAGSYGKMGAAILSSHACLRSGTGLLTTHIPRCGYEILQASLPEAMVSIDKGKDHISGLPDLDGYRSIGIGPGIGRDTHTAKVVRQLLEAAPCAMIIDADALNIISENKSWLELLPEQSILTPHPKEFDRLTEEHQDSWQRLSSAQTLARQYQVIIVLKGAYTATVLPDRSVWFNSTGNPALAKGGSGDVLTGIITALVARGYEPREAALLGVYLHGLAADLGVAGMHPEAFMATDIIAGLSPAFKYLYGLKEN
jgi:hydroxyethylthiazole kinase-like uncharacterized protein yjeF